MRYIISSIVIAASFLVFGFREQPASSAVSSGISAGAAYTNVMMSSDPVEPKASVVEEVAAPAAVSADAFVSYAKSLIGTPYLFGSVNPEKGLDCSGFVNCVSDHFNIKVPRSSVDFTDFGTMVQQTNAKPGDLILFTGTDVTKRVVGHIGIVMGNDNGQITFIHSSSGKANGVTTSELEGYYQTRFVKIVRILS